MQHRVFKLFALLSVVTAYHIKNINSPPLNMMAKNDRASTNYVPDDTSDMCFVLDILFILILLYFCTYIFGILKIHLIHCCIIGKTAVSSVFVLKLFTDTCIILCQLPKIINRTIIFHICEICLTCIFDHCMYCIML